MSMYKKEENGAEFLYGEANAQYDKNAKNVLSTRRILAEIMKRTVEEFKDVPLRDIATKYIEGDPIVGEFPVDADDPRALPSHIRGIRTEESSPMEGTVTFDILFYARLPKTGERVTLIINVEAQRTQHPGSLGYDLMHRAVYYTCRLISSQKEREFTGQNYDDIHKVYSIWLCMDSPTGESSINRYRLSEEQLLHQYTAERSRYDLLTIVMVYLGKRADKDRLIHLLQVLFTEKEKTAEQKEQILEKEYDIELDKKLEEELRSMCNLSLGISEEAYRDGMEQGLEQGKQEKAKESAKTMLSMNMPLETIARISGLSVEEIQELQISSNVVLDGGKR